MKKGLITDYYKTSLRLLNPSVFPLQYNYRFIFFFQIEGYRAEREESQAGVEGRL